MYVVLMLVCGWLGVYILYDCVTLCIYILQAIYERMFTWIVRKINSKVEVQDNYYHHDNNVIGVLDIYGFEIFDNNRYYRDDDISYN